MTRKLTLVLDEKDAASLIINLVASKVFDQAQRTADDVLLFRCNPLDAIIFANAVETIGVITELGGPGATKAALTWRDHTAVQLTTWLNEGITKVTEDAN